MELLAAAIIMMRRRSTRLVAGQYVRTEAATSARWCEGRKKAAAPPLSRSVS